MSCEVPKCSWNASTSKSANAPDHVMPSMSAGVRPASAIARSAASAPISRAVRPDAFVYAVSPMPAIAACPRMSSRSFAWPQPSGTLAERISRPTARARGGRRARRRAGSRRRGAPSRRAARPAPVGEHLELDAAVVDLPEQHRRERLVERAAVADERPQRDAGEPGRVLADERGVRLVARHVPQLQVEHRDHRLVGRGAVEEFVEAVAGELRRLEGRGCERGDHAPAQSPTPRSSSAPVRRRGSTRAAIDSTNSTSSRAVRAAGKIAGYEQRARRDRSGAHIAL